VTLERRRDLRVAAGTYAELLVGGHSMGFFVIGDVSDSGLFLVTPSPVVPDGQRIALRIEGQGLTLEGVIVHVARGPQQSGYGIRLDHPPNDTVERVVVHARAPSTSGPVAPAAAAPGPAAPAPTPTAAPAASARIALILHDEELGTAMALSLNAFRTSTVFLRPDVGLVAALAQHPALDVALVDSYTISTRGPLTIGTLKTHVRARTVIIYGQVLPPAEERRQLQTAGIDQLWLAPLHPFEAMEKLQKKVRGR
jgi:hypothetical protein